jgi:hypothetical protein
VSLIREFNINESVLYRKKTHSVPWQKLGTIESYVAFVQTEGLGQRHDFAFARSLEGLNIRAHTQDRPLKNLSALATFSGLA